MTERPIDLVSSPESAVSSDALIGDEETAAEQQPSTASAENLKLALAAAEAADDRKGGDIVILDVADVAYLADYFVLISGLSPVQVKAIATSVRDTLEVEFGRIARHVEGMGEGRWILIDYGDVVVHCFMADEREFYNLEAFWSHGQRVEWEPQHSAVS